uniref:Kinase D-interacting substrate of 220 kDa-like n=1 Tax=Phallusia mammillata TaxID=59560 RepID=A0A6F9DF33_9ASCI|nr:kinase D-interacting substrate of 220 kDa-like [Phallusia mammillata]
MMNHVVNKALNAAPDQHRPKLLCRYVDDIFATFSDPNSIDIFFNNMNKIHRNIKFKKEVEQEQRIPFLDVLVDSSGGHFSTTTFRKPTCTGLYAKWASFVAFQHKFNLALSLLNRAHRIEGNYNNMHREFMRIKGFLLQNGYPAKFVSRCIRLVLNRRYVNVAKSTDLDSNTKFSCIKLPYLGDINHHIQKELFSFILKATDGKVRVRSFHQTQKLVKAFVHKDMQGLLNRSSVVYRLKCSCGKTYIGETRRNLGTRVHEHQQIETSEVCQHLQANKDHVVDFKNPEVLGTARDRYRLMLLESIFIQRYKP